MKIENRIGCGESYQVGEGIQISNLKAIKFRDLAESKLKDRLNKNGIALVHGGLSDWEKNAFDIYRFGNTSIITIQYRTGLYANISANVPNGESNIGVARNFFNFMKKSIEDSN